jgi:2-succinyl-6-hydroxy-2,4-cyclohexadiene-1-carboxylate synthase
VSGDRIVALHGFSQTGRCWGPLPDMLSAVGYEVSTPDLPGHGDSFDLAYDLATTAAVMADLAGPATYLGYSFGGRVALRLAVDRADVVERLVLIGATAGLEDPAERQERIQADQRLANTIEQGGVAAFLDRWQALPLFAGVPDCFRFRAERLRNSAVGLASSLRLAGAGAQEPIWHRLYELTMPVLIVTGELDAKFEQVGDRLADAIGDNARRVSIAGAGHTTHLEQPDELCAHLLRWLECTGRAASPPDKPPA